MKMKTWRCASCGYTRQERLAKAVLHNCKVAKKLTTFKEIEEDDAGDS